MGIDVFDAIALTLHANGGEIYHGRTVQSLVYFHAVAIKDLDVSDHVHHYHGPFSCDVAVALEDMSEFSYVAQNLVSRYYETYSYRLTESGMGYAEDARQKHPGESGTVDKTVQTCKTRCDLRLAPLSYAAKAHYTMANSGDTSDAYSADDAKAVARDLDWMVSSDDARDGLLLLRDLGLVST